MVRDSLIRGFLALAAGGRDGDNLAGDGVNSREAGNLVMVGHFPGGNGASSKAWARTTARGWRDCHEFRRP